MGIIKNLSSRRTVMNEISSNDTIEINGALLEELHEKLLEMLLDIDRICAKHKIEYFLVGGSCLGAVRHKGFIPWDDDVDIAMSRKAYNTFKRVFEKEASEKYILNAPNYSKESIARFPKILKKDSVYVTGGIKKTEFCKLFIDIFILENVPDSKILKIMVGMACNALEFISGQVLFVENLSNDEKRLYKEYDVLSYYLRYMIGKLFSFFSVSKYNDLIDTIVQYGNDETRNCCLPTGRKHYFGEVLPREVFESIIRIPFEGEDLPVLENYDVYLKNLYGDYMLIPPKHKRETHFVREIKL